MKETFVILFGSMAVASTFVGLIYLGYAIADRF
jgi:hypothetical protein